LINPEAIRALCGINLSAEEFYKIDKTSLAEVLLEEVEPFFFFFFDFLNFLNFSFFFFIKITI